MTKSHPINFITAYACCGGGGFFSMFSTFGPKVADRPPQYPEVSLVDATKAGAINGIALGITTAVILLAIKIVKSSSKQFPMMMLKATLPPGLFAGLLYLVSRGVVDICWDDSRSIRKQYLKHKVVFATLCGIILPHYYPGLPPIFP